MNSQSSSQSLIPFKPWLKLCYWHVTIPTKAKHIRLETNKAYGDHPLDTRNYCSYLTWLQGSHSHSESSSHEIFCSYTEVFQMVQLVLMGMRQETGATREKKWTKSKTNEIVHTHTKRCIKPGLFSENLCWPPRVHTGTQKTNSSTLLLQVTGWVSWKWHALSSGDQGYQKR